VPEHAAPGHWLVEHIGLDAFIKLCRYHSGERIELDRCAQAIRAAFEQQVAREYAQGASNGELALRYGYTERGIRKRVEIREPSPNFDLFDEL